MGLSFRATRSSRDMTAVRDDHAHEAVLDLDHEGVHGQVRRQGQRPARAHVEAGSVPRADRYARARSHLAERPVVVGAPILDGEKAVLW